MTTASEINRPYHERELRWLESMTSHVEVAAAAALFYCAEEGITPPGWAVRSGAEFICSQLTGELTKKPGRATGILERYRQDMIDFERWCAVEQARRDQVKLKNEVKLIRAYPDYPARRREDREKLHAWFGTTWLRAYECAAMTLRGRPAYAGPDAMKQSYCRVQHCGDPSRYYMMDSRFLTRLGLEGPTYRTPGTKLMPLYDLTL